MRDVEFREEAERKLAGILALCKRGLGISDPSRVEVRGKLEFGSNVTVDVNVIFVGLVKLGNDVRIGANCIVEDAIIEDGAAIMEFSTVTSSKIGPSARIGPYARVRPGCRIGASCQIGNFVEIKESTLGTGCKINHHSFVGNAVLGKDVVIGAGSITCNHDGRGIQHTIVDNRAYIGSGVLLIAPVRIGESAMVAAGSTITKDVPANMLAICRTQGTVLKPRNPEGTEPRISTGPGPAGDES